MVAAAVRIVQLSDNKARHAEGKQVPGGEPACSCAASVQQQISSSLHALKQRSMLPQAACNAPVQHRALLKVNESSVVASEVRSTAQVPYTSSWFFSRIVNTCQDGEVCVQHVFARHKGQLYALGWPYTSTTVGVQPL